MLLKYDANEDEIVDALRRAGLRATRPRIAVAMALAGDETHPTAQTIHDRVSPRFEGLSLSTVYNVLGALSRVAALRPLVYDGVTRFDPNVSPHHHAICDGCGAIRDVPFEGAALGPGDRRIPHASLEGFAVQRVEHIYRGVCAPCLGTAP